MPVFRLSTRPKPSCASKVKVVICRYQPGIKQVSRVQPRRRPDQSLRAEPFRVGDGDEPPDRRPRDRRRRLEGARLRTRARPLSATNRHLRARLRRVRKPRASRAPPTASKSATRSASSPVIATRPSTSTMVTSRSAATASNNSGRSPREVMFIDASPLHQGEVRASLSAINRSNFAARVYDIQSSGAEAACTGAVDLCRQRSSTGSRANRPSKSVRPA